MRVATISFVFGVWLLQQQAELPEWDFFVCALPLLIVVFTFLAIGKWPAQFPALKKKGEGEISAPKVLIALASAPLFVVIGFSYAAYRADLRLSVSLPAEWESRDIEVVGVIATLPQENERGLRFEFDLEDVATAGAVVPDRIALSWYKDRSDQAPQSPPLLSAGERWRLTVRLKRPHGNANPHGFDYEVWLLERNLRATGYVREDDDNQRLADLVRRPSYLIAHARQLVREQMRATLGDRPYAGILMALTIGDQNAIANDYWQLFMRSGVTHLMSISGLHVTMLSGLAAALVYWLWRRSSRLTMRLPARKAAAAAGAMVALLYALLAGFAVPTQRTLIMLWVVALALWSGRISSATSVLCVALGVVVLFDPWAVVAAGFWLSFGAIACIMLVGARRLAHANWLTEWGRAQWAVTVGLLAPLLALFHQVSLIAPLANLIAIPVVSLVVVPLSLLGALVQVDFALFAAHEIMGWLMAALRTFDALPQIVWRQHAPAPWAVVVGVIGAIWLLLPRGFPARWLGLVALAPIFLIRPPTPAAGELWIRVLDVGQGLAVVAQTEHHTLLYDSGPAFNTEVDAGNRIVAPYLLASGINELSGMVASHDDVDHAGGAVSVLSALTTAWLVSSLPTAHAIHAHAAQSIRCFTGQQWQWDDVSFEVLHPTLESYDNPNLKDNARGCVLKITSRFGSVLLPADIERNSELEIVERAAGALASDILVAPHHGSKTSSTEAFANAVQPRAVIFSAGYRNQFGHPREEVVKRYLDVGAQIHRSDEDGALNVRFTNEGMSIGAYRLQYPRYWRVNAVR